MPQSQTLLTRDYPPVLPKVDPLEQPIDPKDLVVGCEAIAVELGWPGKAGADRARKLGLARTAGDPSAPPIVKIGGHWMASRRALRRHLNRRLQPDLAGTPATA